MSQALTSPPRRSEASRLRGLATTAGRALVPARYRTAVAGRIRPLRYRGDAVACPCCGGRFAHFRHHREVQDVRCPRCGSLERHRMLALYLGRHPNLLSGPLDFLHIAPEYSLRSLFADRPQMRYVSADLESPLASEHFDLLDIPYPEGSFDAVLCSHVLEHVPDDHAALSELHRVLRPGGWAMLLVPLEHGRDTTLEDPSVTSPEDRLRVFKQEDHARLYGLDFPERVRDSGFEVKIESFARTLPRQVVERHRIGLRDDIFTATRARDDG